LVLPGGRAIPFPPSMRFHKTTGVSAWQDWDHLLPAGPCCWAALGGKLPYWTEPQQGKIPSLECLPPGLLAVLPKVGSSEALWVGAGALGNWALAPAVLELVVIHKPLPSGPALLWPGRLGWGWSDANTQLWASSAVVSRTVPLLVRGQLRPRDRHESPKVTQQALSPGGAYSSRCPEASGEGLCLHKH
jgi:hypothetical protein